MTSTVLITGASGFSGSFLSDHYVERGWIVHGTTRPGTALQEYQSLDVAFHEIELGDRGAVQRLVANVRPDVVHHLAAQSSVGISLQNPMGTLQGNTIAQYNLLQALVESRIHARVVVVGSCEEYGNVAPCENPVPESHTLLPQNPYALSKVVQDLMGYQYAAVHDLQVVRVRPFLQLGPRRASHFAIGSFARQVAEIQYGQRGAVVEVGNTSLVRDFTDVRDVARAYALAAEEGAQGAVYNIASGVGHSLHDILMTMLRLADIDAEIRTTPGNARHGEAEILIGDSSALRSATGWVPQIDFEQSVRDSLAYWQEQVQLGLTRKVR